MGCRVSVQFVEKTDQGLEKSSVIYHHWAGNELPKIVRAWLIGLYKKKKADTLIMPSVFGLIFDFIQHCFKENHFDLNANNSVSLYDSDDLDGADDAGHYVFQIEKDNFKMKHQRGRWQNEPVLKRGKKGF